MWAGGGNGREGMEGLDFHLIKSIENESVPHPLKKSFSKPPMHPAPAPERWSLPLKKKSSKWSWASSLHLLSSEWGGPHLPLWQYASSLGKPSPCSGTNPTRFLQVFCSLSMGTIWLP